MNNKFETVTAKAIHIPKKNRKEYVLPSHRENEICSKFERMKKAQHLTTAISNAGKGDKIENNE